MELPEIVAALFPRLSGDEKAMAVRVKTAESMVKEGWVFEFRSDDCGVEIESQNLNNPQSPIRTPQLTTPLLRFGYGMYFAESRYRLTPNPGSCKTRERWIVESIDHPEWRKPHPHVYDYGGNSGYGLCSDVEYGRFKEEPLIEAEMMAATMSGAVLEGNYWTCMKPFADPKLSHASVCPFCKMDVDRRTTNCQKNGYFYHPNCFKEERNEVAENG